MSNHSPAGVEKCFELAEETGVLQINHKGLKRFPMCDYDLVDVLTVDISKNRFSELPQDLLSFVMVERMNCAHNLIKMLPDLSHLNALSYLDISQNQLQSLPVHLCSLPLKLLKAAHNHISVIPSEIGLLGKLQLLDLACNELTNLPSTMGDLASLRSLNIRRNNIVSLPDELSKLKNLQSLNFSCNKISSIPPAFRLISSLIELDLTNNPLSSPPAQICLKGRLHIVKFLSLAAQQQEKVWTMPKENNVNRTQSPVSNNSEKYTATDHQQDLAEPLPSSGELRRHNTLTNEDEEEEIEVVDHHSSNNVNEETLTRNTESFSPPVADKPKLPKKQNSINAGNQEPKDKPKVAQEKGKLTPQPFKSRLGTPTNPSRRWSENEQQSAGTTMSLDRSSLRNLGTQVKSNDANENTGLDQKSEEERLGDLAARKEQLLKNKEEILKSKHRLELIKSKSLSRSEMPNEKPEVLSPNSVSSQNSNDSSQSDVVFDGLNKRNNIAKPRNSLRKLKEGASNYTMRRFYDSAKEEFEELEKLREAIETRLRIKLPDDLPASLSDGIVLCHLVNHLRKGTIAIIHVPSSGVPKLTMPKCQMNVDAFLDACRKVGVERIDLCTPPDILQEKSPTKLCRTVHALLLAMGVTPPQITVANSATSPR